AHPQTVLERLHVLVEGVLKHRHHQDAVRLPRRQHVLGRQHVRSMGRIEAATVNRQLHQLLPATCKLTSRPTSKRSLRSSWKSGEKVRTVSAPSSSSKSITPDAGKEPGDRN